MLTLFKRLARVSLCNWRRLSVLAGTAFSACLGVPPPACAQQGLSKAEIPALGKPLKRIDQDELLKGRYPLRQVIENGRHLF
jgi:hypothetical protein